MRDPGGKERDVEALAHGCRRALSEGVVGAIWLASGELDSSLKQGCSVSRREALRGSGGAVQVADLDRDAAFQGVTEAEERTGGLGWQERSRSLYTGECLADAAIGEPHPRERQLADERKGRTAVLTHRERLLEHAFCRDEIAALERHASPSANRVDHRRVRGHAYRFGTRERPVREMVRFGQQAFDARNPRECAGQSDLLQAWCGERVQVVLALFACAVEVAEPQPGARDEDRSVLSDLVVGEILRCGIVGQRSFDLVGFSVLRPNESSREHESSAVGIVEVAGAVGRADDPRRCLLGRGTRGQRERQVNEATGICPLRPRFLPW